MIYAAKEGQRDASQLYAPIGQRTAEFKGGDESGREGGRAGDAGVTQRWWDNNLDAFHCKKVWIWKCYDKNNTKKEFCNET